MFATFICPAAGQGNISVLNFFFVLPVFVLPFSRISYGKQRKVPKARPSEETYDIESTLRNILVGSYSNEERGARKGK